MGDLSFFKNFLSGSWLDMLVYVIILSVFIIGLIKCVSPVLHNRALLRRAIRNIRAGTDAKQSWQEDNFLGNGALCAHWSEYLNNLFFADGVYHNASNVEDLHQRRNGDLRSRARQPLPTPCRVCWRRWAFWAPSSV